MFNKYLLMGKISENKFLRQKKLLLIYFLSCQTILHPLSKNFTILEMTFLLNVLLSNVLMVLARFWHVILQKHFLIYEKYICNIDTYRFHNPCHSADNDNGRMYGICR